MMADFWIVTGRTYMRHGSHDAAETERARLAALVPTKSFTVLRCKSDTRPRPDTRAYIAKLEAELQKLRTEHAALLMAAAIGKTAADNGPVPLTGKRT